MACLIIILGVCLLLALLSYWVTWVTTGDDYPRIKFKDFKKFYALNPNRWIILYGFVGCRTGRDKPEYFRFGFIDFGRYTVWYNKMYNNKKARTHMESAQRMMDAVKEDIAKAKAKEATNASFEMYKQMIKELKDTCTEAESLSLVEILKKYGVE